MSFTGKNIKQNSITLTPQAADIATPAEGMVFRADGTSRSKGLWEYKNSAWSPVGSGGGSIINYVSSNDGSSLAGWATYADAAGTIPVDGTGGSPTITFTSSTSSPLFGSASFIFTKDAANRQGEGASYNFSIDAGMQSKVINIQAEYQTSAAFADKDVIFYIYDVTNATLIEPTPRDLYAYASSGSSTFRASFQAASNSTSYRLIIHQSSTNAAAYTIKLDNIVVGPSSITNGAITSEWSAAKVETVLSYGATAATNISSYSTKVRRNGDSADIEGRIIFNGAANANGSFTLTLPDGLVIDTAKIANSNSLPQAEAWLDTSSKLYWGQPYYNTSNTFIIYRIDDAGVAYSNWTGNTTAGSNVPSGAALANNNVLKFSLRSVPIVGWGATAVLGQNADTRDLIVDAQRITSAVTATAGTPLEIIFNQSNKDTHGIYSISTGRVTAAISGYYDVKYALNVLMGATAASVVECYAQINGVGKRYALTSNNSLANSKYYTFACSEQLYLTAGQYVSIWCTATAQNVNVQSDNTDAYSFISVKRSAGPAQIAASEKVYAKYSVSSSTANLSIADNSEEIIDWDLKSFDSHTAVTTGASWKFTAPKSGVYQVSISGRFASATNLVSDYFALYKNTTVIAYGLNNVAGVNNPLNINTLIDLNQGDYLQVKAYQDDSSSAARNLITASSEPIFFCVQSI